jgi:mRNA-degrading endonuclease RelE of RelBE toxin-antitoxin system
MIDYIELPEFRKDFKKLEKRYHTLSGDFTVAKKAAIELFHEREIDNQSIFEINGLNGKVPVYKLKKFACRALKGRGNKSGIRIIYAYNKGGREIHFIEMYFKGDKENEDRARIAAYLKSFDE